MDPHGQINRLAYNPRCLRRRNNLPLAKVYAQPSWYGMDIGQWTLSRRTEGCVSIINFNKDNTEINFHGLLASFNDANGLPGFLSGVYDPLPDFQKTEK